MGLFDQGSVSRNGLSPAAIALLGLLAVKGFENRDKLGDLLGGLLPGAQGKAGGALGGLLGGAATGGAGGILGRMLGGVGGNVTGGDPGSSPAASPASGGAGLGQAVSGGLGSLIDSFEKAGHGDVANSWVKDGPNQQPAPQQVEDAVGGDVLDQLVAASGLSRQELLQRLSQSLPKVVDALTPGNRLPTPEEVHTQVAGGQM